MRQSLVEQVNHKIARGEAKWGHIDRTPVDLMIAVQEEIGEVAHAINHDEGATAIKQEIVDVIGILSRLYEMIDGG